MSVRHIASAFVLAAMMAGPVFAQSSKVLATVNGEAITEAEAKVALEICSRSSPMCQRTSAWSWRWISLSR